MRTTIQTFLKTYLFFVFPFFALLTYFYSTYSYYSASDLTLIVPEVVSDRIELEFDVGSGFKEFNSIKPSINNELNSYQFQLPQLNIKNLRIKYLDDLSLVESSYITINNNKFDVRIDEHSNKISDLDNYNQIFNPKLLFIQILLSLIITILVVNFYNIYKSNVNLIKRIDYKLLLKISLPIITVYFSWFLANFPGLVTNDSLASLSEAKSLIFTDWQPYIYTLYILFILNIYDSIAAISVIQILLFSLTFSFLFYYIFVNLKAKAWFYIIYFFCLFSIPIGLYNNIIWKDIPFSYVIFCVSIFCFFLIRKYYANGKLNLDNNLLLLIFLFYSGLIHLRHNGIFLALFILPFCYKIFNFRSFVKLLATCLVSFFIVFILLPSILSIKITKSAPLFQFNTAIQIMTHPSYYSEDHEKDKQIIEHASGLEWDYIKSNYPQNFFQIWDNSKFVKDGLQFAEGSGDTPEYNKKFLIRLVSENVPIYLSNKSFEFFHSIGIDQSKSDYTNNFYQDPLQLFGSLLHPPGYFKWGISIEAPIISFHLRKFLSRIAHLSTNYSGFFSAQVVIWSLVIPFSLMLFFLLREKWNSPICFYIYPCFLIAFNVFIVGSGQSWRYFYYIYICSIFIIPLYLIGKNDGR